MYHFIHWATLNSHPSSLTFYPGAEILFGGLNTQNPNPYTLNPRS